VRVTRGVESVGPVESAVVGVEAPEPPPASDPEPPPPPSSELPVGWVGAGQPAGPLPFGPVLISKLEDAVVAADDEVSPGKVDHGVKDAVVV